MRKFCHSAVNTTLCHFEGHTCIEICQMAFPATKAPAIAQPAMTSNANPKVYDDPATATNVPSVLSESWSIAAESRLMPPAHHSSISLFDQSKAYKILSPRYSEYMVLLPEDASQTSQQVTVLEYGNKQSMLERPKHACQHLNVMCKSFSTRTPSLPACFHSLVGSPFPMPSALGQMPGAWGASFAAGIP